MMRPESYGTMGAEDGLDTYGRERSLSPEYISPQDRENIFLPAVQSLVVALGGWEEVETSPGKLETVYRPGDSVLAVLKDLKKLWRKDDEDDERTVARCMAKAGLMRELISILVECTDRGEWGRKVALMACDLIAALTWPIDVQQELKEMADEPGVVTDYASLLRYQLEYKAMIIQTDQPLRCLLTLLLPSLAKPRKEERDEKIISLGLHIVRNLLAVKDSVAEGHAIGEKEELASLQSSLIVQLDRLTFFKLFLTLASCADKADLNQYNVLVLDILHLVFRAVKPKDIAVEFGKTSSDKLAKTLAEEKRLDTANMRSRMTRHSRFGTTVMVKAGDRRLVLHKQNALSVDPGKILDDTKKKRAIRAKKVDELVPNMFLNTDALKVLQRFAKLFIKCFNVFFASILKDIRMERSKIRETDNIRTFVLARFFVDYLLILRGQEAEKREGSVSDELALGLVAEMAEMDSIRWVVARMRLTMDERPPAWTELQACLNCFTQILLLLDAMSASTDPDDQEVADILQHQLYYNGEILETALAVVAGYKDQSIGYLDAVVHFAYVLLRMLERYSKSKGFLVVKKKKKARDDRKERAKRDAEPQARAAQDGTAPPTAQQPSAIPEEYGEDEDEDMEPARDGPSYSEHLFTFKSFELRFAQESVVNTLLTYLGRFREFDDPDQMKRVVGLIHRQVIKIQAEGLYFKVSSLHLFRQILDAQNFLPQSDATRDLLQTIRYILRKFFKRVKEDPFVIIDALASKTRQKWKDLSSYHDDDEDGMNGQRQRIREKMEAGLADLEFLKNRKLSWGQQMDVAMAMLWKDGHDDWIKWICDTLEVVLASRQEIVMSTDGEQLQRDDDREDSDEEEAESRRVGRFGGPSKEARDKFEQFDLLADTAERQAALAKDPNFRLMLRLIAFERTSDEEAVDQKFFLPPSVMPASLEASVNVLRRGLDFPPSLDEDPKKLLRKARKTRRRREPSVGDETEYDSEGDPIQRAPKAPKKRKSRVAETQNFKSAAFIIDSDDDDERDAAFFARERMLRAEMEALAKEQGNVMLKKGKRKRKDGTGAEKGKAPAVDVSDSGPEDQGQDMAASSQLRRQARRRSTLSNASPESEADSPHGPLSEMSPSEDEDAPRRSKRKSSPLDPVSQLSPRADAVEDDSDADSTRPA